MRRLREALEKATPRGIRSLLLHTPPTTDPSASIFSLSIATLSLPPRGECSLLLGSPKIQISRLSTCRKFEAWKGIVSKLVAFRLI